MLKFPRLLPIAGLCLVSCGSSNSSTGSGKGEIFPSTSLTSEPILSAGGVLQTIVWTSPDQPPIRGVIEAKLQITDAKSGDMVDGLNLTVVPEMPAMGHGTSVVPTVVAEGGGIYVVSNVDVFMPGTWILLTTIQGTMTDKVSISLDVQ